VSLEPTVTAIDGERGPSGQVFGHKIDSIDATQRAEPDSREIQTFEESKDRVHIGVGT
jgi:hypothetical protein